MNYQVQDPECDLDYVPNVARNMRNLEVVMTSSIGLGGHNAALIFQRL
jgi:3-oxoacyl-(acyl-carrier-protein) synthase